MKPAAPTPVPAPLFIRLLAWLSLVVYGCSLMVYIFSPAQWWLLGILGIGWPYTWLAFGILLIMLYRFGFAYRRYWLLSWLLGLLVMSNVWAMQPNAGKWQRSKNIQSIRVMQWNCEQLGGIDTFYTRFQPHRWKAVQFIREQQPDVIMMQDFQNYESKMLRSNLSLIRDTLGYPYVHFSPYFSDTKPWGTNTEGVIIFSRLPFAQTGRVQYPKREYAPYIGWADVLLQGKPVRLATTHFISMHLNLGVLPADTFGFIYKQDTSVLVTGSKLKKLRYFQAYHSIQAHTLRAFLDTCTVPVILGADLNSVPSSYVYNKVKGQLQDAFLTSGFGLGKTFRHSMLPNLRIDYLLHSPALTVQQLQMPTLLISDHKPLLADIGWY